MFIINHANVLMTCPLAYVFNRRLSAIANARKFMVSMETEVIEDRMGTARIILALIFYIGHCDR